MCVCLFVCVCVCVCVDPLLEGSSLHGGEIALATKHRHNSSFDMNAMELDEIDTQPLRLFGAFMGLYSAPYTWWDILRMR